VPPSAKQIAAAARAQLLDGMLAEETLEGTAATAGEETETGDGDLLAPFRGKLSVEDLARRLLARELARLPVGEKLLPVALPSAGGERGFGRGAPDRPARPRAPGDFAREGVRFRVNLGGKDQADPRWLLPLICRRGGVTRREVGAIRIGPHETIFEIAGDAAADFAIAAAETDPRAPHVRVERIDGSAGAATREVQAPDTRPYAPKPHVARPHATKPYAPKPHFAKPHASKPHFAKPAAPKTHLAKPHGPRAQAAPPPAGGDRPYKRPHAAGSSRFHPKSPHAAGKRRA
jgi:ATP-dependent RNA helicase DeaD